jgi:hypothetical protein
MNKHFANLYVTINKDSECFHSDHKRRPEFYASKHKVVAISFLDMEVEITFNHLLMVLKLSDIDEIFLEEEQELVTVYKRKYI